jgi:hypothetical protein
VSALVKIALVLYMLTTAVTGALAAVAIAVDAWPLAMAIIATWMFGWSPLVIVGYAELERRLEGGGGGGGGAGQAAQTSMGRHRADGPADQAAGSSSEVERFSLLEELAS